jgi:phosphoglycerol transferase MdoB-like AlkP superfamily enzyme
VQQKLIFPYQFLKLYLFWMLSFFITRTIFLIYNYSDFSGVEAFDLLSAFLHALYLDTSMSCYMITLPCLLLLLMQFAKAAFLVSLFHGLNYLFILIVSVITISELPIYDEWSHKLTYKALWFFRQPSEVFFTATYTQLFFGLLGISILSGTLILIYRKFKVQTADFDSSKIKKIALVLIIPALLFTGIRGGFYLIPIQVSDAYFSNNYALNDLSTNSTFHLLSNVAQNLEAYEPYKFMPSEEAKEEVKVLFNVAKDTTIEVLTTNRPNIVLIVFEGWSSDVISQLGGYNGLTPHFDKLIKEGISFDSCYASGSLSDQGMGAVFSAFPAQPRTSIITQPAKYKRLSTITEKLKTNGYSSSFVFGGELNYGNIKSYIYYNGFDKIIEGKDFDNDVARGRLGVHDGPAFQRNLNEIAQLKPPFFAAQFTQSTHGPFDFPKEQKLYTWGEKENDYINSVYYADSCLNVFMNEAKKKEWYKNTLFVFISDHSHNTPKNYGYNQMQYRRIPFVLFGEVIKENYRGLHLKQVCSQLDLAATLLGQLKIQSKNFEWSKNQFNPYVRHNAFYTFDEGLGYIEPSGNYVWHVSENRFEFERYYVPSGKKTLHKRGKAYLQRITEQFWEF